MVVTHWTINVCKWQWQCWGCLFFIFWWGEGEDYAFELQIRSPGWKWQIFISKGHFSNTNVAFLYKTDNKGIKKFQQKNKVASSGNWTHNTNRLWIRSLMPIPFYHPDIFWMEAWRPVDSHPEQQSSRMKSETPLNLSSQWKWMHAYQIGVWCVDSRKWYWRQWWRHWWRWSCFHQQDLNILARKVVPAHGIVLCVVRNKYCVSVLGAASLSSDGVVDVSFLSAF